MTCPKCEDRYLSLERRVEDLELITGLRHRFSGTTTIHTIDPETGIVTIEVQDEKAQEGQEAQAYNDQESSGWAKDTGS